MGTHASYWPQFEQQSSRECPKVLLWSGTALCSAVFIQNASYSFHNCTNGIWKDALEINILPIDQFLGNKSKCDTPYKPVYVAGYHSVPQVMHQGSEECCCSSSLLPVIHLITENMAEREEGCLCVGMLGGAMRWKGRGVCMCAGGERGQEEVSNDLPSPCAPNAVSWLYQSLAPLN